MNRHHYLALVKLSAPSENDHDEEEVRSYVHAALGRAVDRLEAVEFLRVEEVDVSIIATDLPEER